ncbi:MAG: class I SAM-dependent methyltransferase [Chloroflexi bacterium]|nr:class I SAM-dependent methyltransferase [Chloroflexota bacterium]
MIEKGILRLVGKMSFEARQKWSILASAWKDTGPPAAPSLQDVSNYIGHISKRKATVLLLGCTSSLRNRLLGDSCKVVSVDITRRMLEATKPLVTESDADIVVQGDWLHLPLNNNEVDAVVGDKILGNVMPEEWAELFAEVKRVSRPTAPFLTRASPHGEDLLQPPAIRPFSELVKRWAIFYKEGMDIDSACSGLWEDCMDMSTVSITPFVGTQQLKRVIPITKIECLSSAGKEQHAISLVRLFIRKFWHSREARWSAYTVKGILTAASIHFDYVGQYTATDYPEGDRQPVFHFVSRT